MIPKKTRDRIVVSMYQKGDPVYKIMATASIGCPNTLYKILRANNVTLRRSREGTSMDKLVGPLSYLLFEEGMEPSAAAIELELPLSIIMQVIEERM